jgi:hypothetical protein
MSVAKWGQLPGSEMEPSELTAPKVFISYSHDSREHEDRVLSLAHRLRKDGVGAVPCAMATEAGSSRIAEAPRPAPARAPRKANPFPAATPPNTASPPVSAFFPTKISRNSTN